MAVFTLHLLSGSTDGRPIKVAASATPGTTVHTTGTSQSVIDKITIYAFNSDSSDRLLTLEWGGTTDPDHLIEKTVPAGAEVLMVWQRPLTGDGASGRTVAAFGAAANVIVLTGDVVRYT